MEYYRENHRQISRNYFCYSFSSNIERPELENGDKILMPPSALEHLMALNINYPMMFSIQNPNNSSRTSHCGVLEFTAEEGFVYIPQWMMDNLKLQQGDLVIIKNVSLPNGTYVKLQPHTANFINLTNPKAVLERTLKKYTCLTSGDTITINHNDKKFFIDVLETKPGNAISIIETDCEVDFAAPLDYKEPEKKTILKEAPRVDGTKSGEGESMEKPKFASFTGLGKRLDGMPVVSDELMQKYQKIEINEEKACARTKRGEGESTEKPKFVPFTGLGRRLDGMPVESDELLQKYQKIEINEEKTSSKTCARAKPGKMVFGSDCNTSKESTELLKHDTKGEDDSKKEGNTKGEDDSKKEGNTKGEDDSKKEGNKFQPFTGKKYTLGS
ncbi:hypothetical protein ACH5RR_039872 [Cinchona calisaya]|uniref:Ubiquitin fusion degradaton protein n=1 Tax=Cinchona calisaya TaxID=153742 RepID=A0ABD2Y4R4_9GENT